MSTQTPVADGQTPAGSARENAEDLAGQAQEKAQQLTGQATGKLREQLDQRTSQVASQIGQQASDLRTVGQSLREQGKDGPARAADTVAQYAEKAGSYLEDKDAEGLLADLEDFGRKRPWAAGLGGLALGMAASRFLKASSRRRYSSRSGGSTPAIPSRPVSPPVPRPPVATEPFRPPATPPAAPTAPLGPPVPPVPPAATGTTPAPGAPHTAPDRV